MLKKAGIITVGVSAALLAAAPLASAGEYQGDNNSDNHHSDHHGDHKGHHKGHGDNGKGGWGNTSCQSSSGDVDHNKSEGILALGPILDGNSGQILSCNSFLNNNFSNNHVNVANHLLGS